MVQTRPGSKRGAAVSSQKNDSQAGDVLSRFHLSLTLRDYLYVSRRLAQILSEMGVFCFVWCLQLPGSHLVLWAWAELTDPPGPSSKPRTTAGWNWTREPTML